MSTFIVASVAAMSLYGFGLIGSDALPLVFRNWWMGDALSYLLFTPAVLAIFYHEPLYWSKARLLEAGILSLLLLAACLMVFIDAMSNELLANPRALVLIQPRSDEHTTELKSL